MPFAHLTPERSKAIRTAFNETGKAYDDEARTLMMDSIAPEYVQSLPKFSSHFNQLTGDLNNLNSVGQLKNGQVPLKLWLKNAIEVFAGLPGVATFEQALVEMNLGPAGQESPSIIEGFEQAGDSTTNSDR